VKAVAIGAPTTAMITSLWTGASDTKTEIDRTNKTVTVSKRVVEWVGYPDPVPLEKSKYPEVRYFHIFEGDDFEKQLAQWVKQASKLPGEKM